MGPRDKRPLSLREGESSRRDLKGEIECYIKAMDCAYKAVTCSIRLNGEAKQEVMAGHSMFLVHHPELYCARLYSALLNTIRVVYEVV